MSSHQQTSNDEGLSFLANILTPGSSLHPTFLFVVDFVLAFLAFLFICLAIMSGGNIHFMVLFVIVLGLWGSIKWCVITKQMIPRADGLVGLSMSLRRLRLQQRALHRKRTKRRDDILAIPFERQRAVPYDLHYDLCKHEIDGAEGLDCT
jgi:hypothetical protein